MTALLPSILHSSDLSLAELCAARLDGEVVGLDECFVPVDGPVDSTARARALCALAGGRGTAERDSALWIFGILARPPLVHTLVVNRENRSAVTRTRRITVREAVLRRGDTAPIGGMQITTPTRTAFDLLRGETFGTRECEHVFALFEHLGTDAAACYSRIEAVAKLPGRRRALGRLDELGRADDLSRH